MNDLSHKTIGEIVVEDYRTADIFEKYGIDFCCNGNRSFAEVCIEKSIDPDELLSKIKSVAQDSKYGLPDFNSWPQDLLTDYIEKQHHRYVESKIPVLKQYLEKLCNVHGDKHAELLEIAKLFNESAGELTAHMKKEEFILFPYIRKMVKAQRNGEKMSLPQFDTVATPIQTMMGEHDNEGKRFREINRLSKNYQPPQDACNTFRVAYATLQEFEKDLHLHIHLENNILFPKAMEMEKELIP